MEEKKARAPWLGAKEKWLLASVALCLISCVVPYPRFYSLLWMWHVNNFQRIPALMGMLLVYLTGGMDLSLIGNMELCNVAFALSYKLGMPVAVCALIALAVGVGLGAVNGLVCKRFGSKSRWRAALASLAVGLAACVLAAMVSANWLVDMKYMVSSILRDAEAHQYFYAINGAYLGNGLCLVVPLGVAALFCFGFGGRRIRGAEAADRGARIDMLAYCASGLLIAISQVAGTRLCSAGVWEGEVFTRVGAAYISPESIHILNFDFVLSCLNTVVRYLMVAMVAGAAVPVKRGSRRSAFIGLLNLIVAAVLEYTLLSEPGLLIYALERFGWSRFGSTSMLFPWIVLLLLAGLANFLVRCKLRGKRRAQVEQPRSDEARVGTKSKVAAALLAFFLGSTGAHRYYLGWKKQAIAQTCGFVCSLLGGLLIGVAAAAGNEDILIYAWLLLGYGGAVDIWVIVDFIRILVGSLAPADGSGYARSQPRPVQVVQAPPAASDGADALKKLSELRDEGILTEEEFQRKKAEILERM